MQPPETIPSWTRWGFLAWFLPLLLLLARPVFGQHATVVLPAGSAEATIQHALDTLAYDGEVLLAAGQYEISRPLLLQRDGAALRGAGATTILRLADGANCPAVILGPPVDKPKLTVSHLRLSNLIIDGNRTHQKREAWRTAPGGFLINNNGVHVWNAANVTVERVYCCRCRSGGMVVADVVHLQVRDFHSYDNQFDGLACYNTTDSRFEGLRLHDNVAAGISLDLDFNHNVITNAILTANDLGIFMRDSRDNLFQKVTVIRSKHDGVFMAQSVAPTGNGWQLLADTECTGNTFEALTVRDCAGRAFQVNDATCTNNIISGAVFLRNAEGGLNQPGNHPVRLIEMAGR